MSIRKIPYMAAALLCVGAVSAETQLYWGDTHLHSNYSVDAYFLGNTSAGPDQAYRYAKGLPTPHPFHKARIQIETPLDFLVVSDHAEMVGLPMRLFNGDKRLEATDSGKRYKQMKEEGRSTDVFLEFLGAINNEKTPAPDMDLSEERNSVWRESLDVTERYNDPGRFSAIIGWEWTSTPQGNNLHRVVMMPDDAAVAGKFTPYSAFDSSDPEDLWRWLAVTATEHNTDFVSMPHNSNLSGGLMFPLVDSDGNAINADYGRLRMRWEPVVEMTQIKGDSETDPGLSPDDEFADFEPFKHGLKASDAGMVGGEIKPDGGDYARSALMRGLEQEARAGVNPFKFGMIGATDAHTSSPSAEENNFHGKIAFDSTPENTFAKVLGIESFGSEVSASGLAAVWAESNTREDIIAAFKRKEVYATTGPRIALRVFGGFDFQAQDAGAVEIAALGYHKGVPMGGDISAAPKGKAPSLLIHASKDPVGGNLDRVQVVKGWLGSDGKARERVYDVAWSGDRQPDSKGKLPAVGNTVDLETATYSNDIGSAEFAVVWTDPDFDPKANAFYYVRVLQIPTPRHSLYDAVALQIDHDITGRPAAIQERAYSSPIWYAP